jgi:FkbM family methyltransferase
VRELKTEAVDTFLGRLHLIQDDIVSKALKEGQHWDGYVYDALAPFLDGVVIDVGANVGALTIRFAQVAPYVIAYEPHPVLAACLRANLETLGLSDKVQIRAVGLYSRAVRLGPWTSQPDESPSSWAPNPEGEAVAGPHVDSGARVSAIKVDAQGADLHALLGLREVIERDHPRIVFEYEGALAEKHGHTWADYEKQLGDWGYLLRSLGAGDWEAR